MLPLGIYEGQLGLAAAWVAILVTISLYKRDGRWLSLLIPFFLMGLFALWRTFGVQAIGVNDQYIDQIVTSPVELLSRILLGYKVTLLWGWSESIGEFVPWATNTVLALTLLAVLLALTIGLVWFLSGQAATEERVFEQRKDSVHTYLTIAVSGILLIAAGYAPVILVFLPSLSGIGSRFNLFATIGGAVVTVAALLLMTQALTRSARQQRWLLVAAVFPFILLGIATQISVQYHNRLAWREQQDIWAQLFTLAPDIKEETMLLFVLSGFEDRTGFVNWRRTPLSASWEASSGLRLLYDNELLMADVYFPDIDEPTEPLLTADGVHVLEMDIVVPYEQIVIFTYESGSLKQLVQLDDSWRPPGIDIINLCQDCILDVPADSTPWRSLVND